MFRPKRQFLRLETRLPQSDETDRQLEAAGLDLMPYKWNKYRVRLTKTDAAKHEPLLSELMRRAYDSGSSWLTRPELSCSVWTFTTPLI